MSPTIALVDDDRNILTSVSIALQSEGFAVRIYSDGEAALKALLDNPPDLAVLDIKMPRMDGMELLRRLREKSSIPTIFLTSTALRAWVWASYPPVQVDTSVPMRSPIFTVGVAVSKSMSG